MQSVTSAFTAEEKDSVRSISHNLQASWKKDSLLGNREFTIGVSTIGGSDVIGVNPGAVGNPANYRYFDESAYVTSLTWERGYNMPTGGLSKALAEASLDNTSGRFTPRYMGGTSELYTAEPLQSPIIISAGFNVGGVDSVLAQFEGVITEQPAIDTRNKTFNIQAADYIDYFQNKSLEKTAMYTGLRTDEVLVKIFDQAGMNTAQYELDPGVNLIPFTLFPSGTKFSDAISKLVEAENGHFYQREDGKFIFENRQHWDSSPYTEVQKIIYTSQVINAEAPNADHLVNVVEVSSEYRAKQPNQVVFTLGAVVLLPAKTSTELFVDFDDPVLALDTPSGWIVNKNEDGSGVDISSSVTLQNIDTFAQAAKMTFYNNSTSDGFITSLSLTGRPAKVVSNLYTRRQDDSSVTAFQERVLTINNEYIQNETWANTYAQMILNDFAEVENLQKITVRGLPELQLGDLVSWQGNYWRIFDIKSTIEPSVGFVQELLLLQRTVTSYFRSDLSQIGGTDKIAP